VKQASRIFIESYGVQRFRIGGQVYTTPVLIVGDAVHAWAVASLDLLDIASLEPVVAIAPEVLLIGCGARAAPLPKTVQAALRAVGIVADVMGTGAACRTFNVLVGEDRRVAAALIPV
jgi:uncharacterized protein